MKITMFAHFREYYGNHKNVYDFGDDVSKLQTFVWILNNISRFIAWSQ